MYFKVMVNAADEEIKRISNKKKAYIHEKTDVFNGKSGDVRACLTEIDVSSLTVLLNIPFRRKEEAERIASEYLKYIGLESVGECTMDEVDGSDFYACLINAETKEYVERGTSLRARSVSRLVHGDGVADYLIPSKTPDNLITRATSSLYEEINRINSSTLRGFYGHPVHYIFLMDSDEVIDYSLSELLYALYDKGRLISRRVVSVGRKKDLSESDMNLGCSIMRPAKYAYETNEGGTVVLFPSTFKEASENRVRSEFILDDFIELLSANTMDVLSIIVLPRSRADDAVSIINVC